MKRLFLAAALIYSFPSPSGSAEAGAYGSLVALARSAPHDRDSDEAAIESKGDAKGDLKDAVADAPARRLPPGSAAVRSDAARAPGDVKAPPAASRRPWTKSYSDLLPSWGRAPSAKAGFEAPVSTSATRAPERASAAADPDTVRTGERRGLAELLSVTGPR